MVVVAYRIPLQYRGRYILYVTGHYEGRLGGSGLNGGQVKLGVDSPLPMG